MTVSTTTHLNFRGDARAALEFYRSASGGELVITTYRDAGRAVHPAEADQVLWGQVRGEGGFHVMAFDVPSSRAFSRGEESFFVSLRGSTKEEITELWDGLSDGATVIEDLAPSPWSPLYGMLRDRFGITWVLDVAVEYPAA
ncbi:VOC family protein [Pseudonocardia lacus]|uniref:VOC family protein n=1 Tax=Pseudonocardia lacus TaxID=2835865 RepID=UPI001BDD0D1C|nr:VOC family protein [Pseudonocardia lacus]